jgi:hypothetical protein
MSRPRALRNKDRNFDGDLDNAALKERIAGLKAARDQVRVGAERAAAMLESSGLSPPYEGAISAVEILLLPLHAPTLLE